MPEGPKKKAAKKKAARKKKAAKKKVAAKPRTKKPRKPKGVTLPPPGFYPDVPETVYRKWPAVNQSLLKDVRDYHPEYAYEQLVSPSESTEAMKFGTAIHAALFEPETFEEGVVPGLTIKRQGEKNISEWLTFELEHRDQIILTPTRYDLAMLTAEKLRAHNYIGPLVNNPQRRVESAMIWKDPRTGMMCKAKIDLMTAWKGRNWLVDLKMLNTKGAKILTEVACSKRMGELGHDFQAGMYLDGMLELYPDNPIGFLIIYVQPEPFDARIIAPDFYALKNGRWKYRTALRTWAKCVETGIYPGHPEVAEIALQPYDDVIEREFDESTDEELGV